MMKKEEKIKIKPKWNIDIKLLRVHLVSVWIYLSMPKITHGLKKDIFYIGFNGQVGIIYFTISWN